jgi:Uncharacterized membrane protein (homolog of Drosophila rhomboid)
MLAEEPVESIDFEQGMRYWPPATLSLIVLLVTVFAWQIASGAFQADVGLVDAGALVRARVLEGEYWRMLSATLLHGGFDHLIGNCLALYILGLAGEHALGAWRVLLIYVASGLAGSVASVLTGARSIGRSVGGDLRADGRGAAHPVQVPARLPRAQQGDRAGARGVGGIHGHHRRGRPSHRQLGASGRLDRWGRGRDGDAADNRNGVIGGRRVTPGVVVA